MLLRDVMGKRTDTARDLSNCHDTTILANVFFCPQFAHQLLFYVSQKTPQVIIKNILGIRFDDHPFQTGMMETQLVTSNCFVSSLCRRLGLEQKGPQTSADHRQRRVWR